MYIQCSSIFLSAYLFIKSCKINCRKYSKDSFMWYWVKRSVWQNMSFPNVQIFCQKSYQNDVYYNYHSLFCGFDFLVRSVFELYVSNKV